ncbi:MAG: hypothetical protein SAJ12_09990 [Jaaginema sp. PMC 1079.18]|nr:hypothetical protein [Jaaginema sp. PMC 1080.18]MEC4851330.1 hypothetical protein [Jaaginema sp. PMC 1079.18]MEC4865857.1 hypothetical protein [Jaaginema sp. PMC 1078.18]
MGYRSAIARQLSSQWQKSPEAIASSLGAILAQQQSDWEIRVLPQGWLEGKLCHRSLAAWLQHSLEFIVPTVADTTETPLTAALFPLQYIHVRFCTLLQMAHRDRLIRLEYPDTPPPWRWQSPQNVPWLQNHRIRFSQTAEWALLGQIWDILDLEAIAPTKIGLQAALRLGKAGLQFEQTCRIWGEVQRNTPQLALTRLALVAMAQKVLWRLLREQLQVTPRWRL